MENIIDIIKLRKSVRNYGEQPIEAAKHADIEKYLQQEFQGPFGSKSRFRLWNLSELGEGKRGTLGSYGLIRGAKEFIAGATETSESALLDYGYCMEKVILKMTELGLGTCWMAGFSRKAEINRHFTDKFGMEASQTVQAITPIGYPANKPGVIDSAILLIMKTNKRKPWPELFFNDGGGGGLPEQQAGKYAQALEAVRLAPSASNVQPWRIFKDPSSDMFHFYRKGGHIIDLGIAMLHFETAAQESGLSGKWIKQDERNGPAGMEYVASWIPGHKNDREP